MIITTYLSCGKDPQTEEIYNINALLLILCTDIVRFCNLMHQNPDKSISIRQIRGRGQFYLNCVLKMFQTLQVTTDVLKTNLIVI